MAGAVGRGAQTMSFMCPKPTLRKSYHMFNTCPDMTSEGVKLNGEEMMKKKKKNSGGGGGDDGGWWLPDDRTGIYYPNGQEKVLQDVPPSAARDFGVNWFSKN